MSLDNRFQDLLISIFESSEAGGRKKRLLVATLGIIATICVWSFHLHYPSYLFNSHGVFSKLVIVIILAPPFLTVLSLAQLLFPAGSLSEKIQPGPLSTHLQREDSKRRWKIMIAAGMVSAANLLSMILLSRSAG